MVAGATFNSIVWIPCSGDFQLGVGWEDLFQFHCMDSIENNILVDAGRTDSFNSIVWIHSAKSMILERIARHYLSIPLYGFRSAVHNQQLLREPQPFNSIVWIRSLPPDPAEAHRKPFQFHCMDS